MVVKKAEDQLIKDVIKCAQTYVLILSVLGVFIRIQKRN